MASKIEKMYPLTKYAFDHNKSCCRVCRRKLMHPAKTKWKDESVLYTIYFSSLCSLECLIEMHKANEEQLDLFLEWGDRALEKLANATALP